MNYQMQDLQKAFLVFRLGAHPMCLAFHQISYLICSLYYYVPSNLNILLAMKRVPTNEELCKKNLEEISVKFAKQPGHHVATDKNSVETDHGILVLCIVLR